MHSFCSEIAPLPVCLAGSLIGTVDDPSVRQIRSAHLFDMQGASQAGSPHSEASRHAAQLPTVNIAVLFLV